MAEGVCVSPPLSCHRLSGLRPSWLAGLRRCRWTLFVQSWFNQTQKPQGLGRLGWFRFLIGRWIYTALRRFELNTLASTCYLTPRDR